MEELHRLESEVAPIGLYFSETGDEHWGRRREELLDAKCLRRVLGVKVMDRIRNKGDIRERC